MNIAAEYNLRIKESPYSAVITTTLGKTPHKPCRVRAAFGDCVVMIEVAHGSSLLDTHIAAFRAVMEKTGFHEGNWVMARAETGSAYLFTCLDGMMMK